MNEYCCQEFEMHTGSIGKALDGVQFIKNPHFWSLWTHHGRGLVNVRYCPFCGASLASS